MNYIGIDVGVDKYHIVWYSDSDRRIRKEHFRDCKKIPDIIKSRDCVIAIDAPSSSRKYKNKPRNCEEKLGIKGYFETPYRKQDARPWMISGFKLWEALLKKGFRRAVSKPVKKGQLIEVHPTLIFKKMLNPDVSPELWISRREPVSKNKSSGKIKRREILKDRLPRQSKEIDNLNVDYLDALIAAYTAEQSCSGKVEVFGDPNEGQIWL